MRKLTIDNPILKITMSESDLIDIRDGEVMEWEWTTNTGDRVDLVIGLGTCCDKCGEEILIQDLVETDHNVMCEGCSGVHYDQCVVCKELLDEDTECYEDENTGEALCTRHSVLNEATGNYKKF